MTAIRCRACGAPLSETFADLGMTPLANSYIAPENRFKAEATYPLHAFVCGSCFLVQIDAVETPDHIFSDYLYFSSFSESWLKHAAAYAEAMTARFALSKQSMVVEIASNDGYLLQNFVRTGIPALGVEPAANVARAAEEKGVLTEVAFFGTETATRLKAAGKAADLMAANNVLAHVPDINDFVAGFRILLKPTGVVTFEFPHLLQLMANNQFDTIYHEHFSYLSLMVVDGLLAKHGLTVFDVQELTTHGGSLRVFAKASENAALPRLPSVEALLAAEKAAGLDGLDAYRAFAAKVVRTKVDLLDFFVQAQRAGKTVAAYGAAAKGNTLLNYCGIGPEFISFCVDKSPHKQNHLLPGTHIPIHGPEAIEQARPDYVLILPWNLKEEIAGQMQAVRSWGGKFVVAIPTLTVF